MTPVDVEALDALRAASGLPWTLRLVSKDDAEPVTTGLSAEAARYLKELVGAHGAIRAELLSLRTENVKLTAVAETAEKYRDASKAIIATATTHSGIEETRAFCDSVSTLDAALKAWRSA